VRPSLSTVDDLIVQGRDIPIFLDKLSELEVHAATGRTWLQKAAETFLLDPSHSLISVRAQNWCFGSCLTCHLFMGCSRLTQVSERAVFVTAEAVSIPAGCISCCQVQ